MAVTQGSQAVVNLASRLSEQISAGTPARATLGSQEHAFSWTAGLPRGLWSFVSTATVTGPGFDGVIVAPSLTPAAKVAEGAAKPVAVTMTAKSWPLAKYAGLAEFTLESSAYSDVLPQAVAQTLIAGALVALEADAIAALNADSGLSQTGDTSWTSAILGAIGQVAGNGGNPGLLVMSAADFADAVTTPTQLAFSGADAIPSYLGLDLHLSPKAVAGTAYVLDRSAVVVAESDQSASVVVDPFSKADTNEIRVVADVMAVTAVTSPGLVAEVTPTITGTTRSGEEKHRRAG